MDATNITFSAKDVVGICIGLISILAFIYALKKNTEDSKKEVENVKLDLIDYKKEVEEKFVHAKNAKKANIESIMEHIKLAKQEMEKTELKLYDELDQVKKDQKDAHEKMNTKLDQVVQMQHAMNVTLAELTGFLKGKRSQEEK